MSGPGDQRSLFPSDRDPDDRGLALPDLWIERPGPEGDIVVSSRMRLARNIDGFHFKTRFQDGEGERLEVFLRDVLAGVAPDLRYHSLPELSETEREVLFERHLVSREHASDEQPRGVACSADGTVSVMVNEEDHLRLQAFAPGLSLDAVGQRLNHLDDEIARRVTYSFDERFGFRTSCPTNTGTGLRVSVMFHLPALSFRPLGAGKGQERDIVRLNNAAQQLGLTVRGLFGESSRSDGDFFQISNQVTLGRSEEETIASVRQLALKVLDWERRNRQILAADNRVQLEDHVWRAWALLTHARRMSSGEALGHLSALRLGLCLGVIEKTDIATLQRLMVTMRPGHLQYAQRKVLHPDDRDAVRADLIRDNLLGRENRR